MKRYNRPILLFCIATLLTGCKAELPVDPTDTVSLEITTGIDSQSQTRSMVFGTQFSHESRIKVLGINQATSVLSNAIYVCKNPTGTSEAWAFAGAGIALGTDNMRILACYPSDEGLVDATCFTPNMNTTQAIGEVTQYNSDNSFYTRFGKTTGELQEVVMGDEEKDYMTGADQRNTDGSLVFRDKTDKEATLTMKHCMAIAVFHVKKSALNTNPGIVKAISIQNKNSTTGPLRNGKFALENNAFTPDARIGYERTMDKFPDGCYYGLMVYPATMASNTVEVQLEVDLITYKFDLPAKEWKSGTILLYEIELLPTKAKLMDTVQVLDWEVGDKNSFEIN